ncbi:photosystem II S4 domain protein [Cyanobium sp. CH-040]|uniref:photosystem II S4 domain protein n=1 Tax=Cyanobium sp. CH-040 TaxID=2823708 RepID=UPI0020CCD2BA|nr:photosystem II S4 domain protein [Cyanobium sp. CH-040]MCP9928960.1 photosystem II S4 domain protein [Cyanobium sp. CH-040]
MLPRRQLLEGSRHPAALEAVLDAAETALRTWEPTWTGFLDGAVREEATERLAPLAELQLHAEGGFAGAERQRLLLLRRETGLDPQVLPADLGGLEISGNFLFDPAEPADLRQALLDLGTEPASIGDLWMRGDRGGQGVLTGPAARALDGRQARVRTVEVQLGARPLADLQPPVQRRPRRWHTVEASCRLDAVASAGFGLSRARMAELIRGGQVRVNWTVIDSPSRELAAGDRVQIGGRGELALIAVNPTKRERWRIDLERR